MITRQIQNFQNSCSKKLHLLHRFLAVQDFTPFIASRKTQACVTLVVWPIVLVTFFIPCADLTFEATASTRDAKRR